MESTSSGGGKLNMVCGGCGNRRAEMRKIRKENLKSSIMTGYKYLNRKQLNNRLEIFKKRFCGTCISRKECDIVMYKNCIKI